MSFFQLINLTLDPDCLWTLLYDVIGGSKKTSKCRICLWTMLRGNFTSFFSLHNRRLPKKLAHFFFVKSQRDPFLSSLPLHWLTAQFYEKNKLSKARHFAESADIFAGQRSGSKEAQSAIWQACDERTAQLKVKAGKRAEKDSKSGLFSEKIVDPDFDRVSKSRKVCMI